MKKSAAAIARELSRTTQMPSAPKGEVTVLVVAAAEVQADIARIDSLLDKALDFMPVRAAADLVAEAARCAAPRGL